jgi:hypothetical protein
VTLAFKYSCFISYAAGEGDLTRKFIHELHKALASSIEPWLKDLPVYIDRQRIMPGYRYNSALAHALCQSVCMVLIHTPSYWSPVSYCIREYRAMCELEERRYTMLGLSNPELGMIIPVLFRGHKGQLPHSIRGHIHCLDFSRFTTASAAISRNSVYISGIEEIATFIWELHQQYQKEGLDLTSDCSDFVLPPPEPGQPLPAPPFPGRE